MKKTATLERSRGVSGHPSSYRLSLKYHGKYAVSWVIENVWVPADAPDYGDESVEGFRELAKQDGFTHIRFAGDWAGRDKPREGKL